MRIEGPDVPGQLRIAGAGLADRRRRGFDAGAGGAVVAAEARS
jgi:hypothetical protein